MSDETWQQIVDADAILFGAIGVTDYADIPAEHRQVDWLLEMRRSSTCTRTCDRCGPTTRCSTPRRCGPRSSAGSTW